MQEQVCDLRKFSIYFGEPLPNPSSKGYLRALEIGRGDLSQLLQLLDDVRSLLYFLGNFRLCARFGSNWALCIVRKSWIRRPCDFD